MESVFSAKLRHYLVYLILNSGGGGDLSLRQAQGRKFRKVADRSITCKRYLKFAIAPELVHQAFFAAASSFSSAVIFSTRRSCRPPANCVVSHLSTMRRASSGLTMRAPSVSTLALLCSRLIWASYSLLTLAARIPSTLLAAMAMPIPLPH